MTDRRFERRRSGFTLVELLAVIAIIAILALLATPSFADRIVREQIVEAVKFTDFVKAPIATGWRLNAVLPVDNAAAGLPSADRIVSNYVSAVAVESGAIQLTFGNRANGHLSGKTLTIRPGVVADANIVPVAWVCGNAEPPQRMVARGLNKTNVPQRYLPVSCRGAERPGQVG